MTDTTRSADPKVESRRQQIVDAASICARRAGFHGASMAEIAQAAGLSVGQIYRYFESKEAIIAAIVARDMAEMRDKFSQLEGSGEPLAAAIIDGCSRAVEDSYDLERSALKLEVLAEAARNPRVAAILQDADVEERALKLAVLKQIAPPGCDDRELAARGEVLSMLFEGMAVRGVNNPATDRAAIGEVLRSILRHLLVEAAREPAPQPGIDREHSGH
ncbi:MAG: TetR family transcriptional regulator [Phenylobacterium sp.]|jgi:AcrR family transcriptional regulator|uniref:TetR/AcrR family transcriptional regulator n=1 Tax=Phenylobacterium sp. TaxID=1871053 RepID=UPI00262EE274|nr:TetR/AcrR family transcriptional regulator [Phenylobacterium sp.]MDB5436975.1 TetR family transcriptional regulator [Phenylobacterium sp.]MDB5497928.1 TetR family transcriptional regulator [Phenylobacterium sp.]